MTADSKRVSPFFVYSQKMLLLQTACVRAVSVFALCFRLDIVLLLFGTAKLQFVFSQCFN